MDEEALSDQSNNLVKWMNVAICIPIVFIIGCIIYEEGNQVLSFQVRIVFDGIIWFQMHGIDSFTQVSLDIQSWM